MAEQNEFNFDDMSDDAAATEFCTSFGNLVSYSGGTPEDVAEAVDSLLETLNNCVSKASTLEEMAAYVFDSAAGAQVIHYTASLFLADLAAKFTREVEGTTFAKILMVKLRDVEAKTVVVVNQLAEGNADAASVVEVRNSSLFMADILPKLLPLPSFRVVIPALIFEFIITVDALIEHKKGIPQKEFLDNAFCAIQMLKMTGPTIDEHIRNDPTLSQKLQGEVPKMYRNIRDLLTTSNDLTSRIRAGIIKVLEFRASRWGEVPSPDEPLSQDEDRAADEVDPVWYGPDNAPLSKEETDFLNEAAGELRLHDSDDEDEEEDEGEAYVLNGHFHGYDEQPEEGRFIWEQDVAPDEAMEEFRRRQKPGYVPDSNQGDHLIGSSR